MTSLRTASQDGGVGRHALLPCTTKRRTTTNLKTKSNQNCQKIEPLWKSNNQGVKKETFIHTGRRGGVGQPRWRGCAARQLTEQGQVVASGLGDPTFACG